MPTPSFIPLVGSSFDSLANQSQYWSGFNSRVDEANLRRAQEAEMAQNQWFTRLAEMQQQEAERRDRLSEAASRTAQNERTIGMNARLATQRGSEQQRQFEVDRAFQERKFKVYEKELDQAKATKSDFAKHLQPLLTSAGSVYDAAEEEYTRASGNFLKRVQNAETSEQFPTGKVVLNKATQLFEVRTDPLTKQSMTLLPAEAEAVKSANKDLADIAVELGLATHKLDVASADWQAKQAQASKIGGVPIKQGKTWLLRIPELGMTFGEMVKEAKGEAPVPASDGPVWQPPTGSFAADMQSWKPMPPEMAGPPVASAAPAGPVTKVWRRGANGRLELVQ